MGGCCGCLEGFKSARSVATAASPPPAASSVRSQGLDTQDSSKRNALLASADTAHAGPPPTQTTRVAPGEAPTQGLISMDVTAGRDVGARAAAPPPLMTSVVAAPAPAAALMTPVSEVATPAAGATPTGATPHQYRLPVGGALPAKGYISMDIRGGVPMPERPAPPTAESMLASASLPGQRGRPAPKLLPAIPVTPSSVASLTSAPRSPHTGVGYPLPPQLVRQGTGGAAPGSPMVGARPVPGLQTVVLGGPVPHGTRVVAAAPPPVPTGSSFEYADLTAFER